VRSCNRRVRSSTPPSTQTTQNASGPTRGWYQFASPSYNAVDQLRSYTAVEPGVASKAYAFAYDSMGGSGRLTRSQTTATVSRTYQWGYDVFGNRRSELFTSTGGEACQGTAPLDVGSDNRLVARHSFPGCPRLSRYWSDQAGNRLGETDTAGVAQAQMTYTAAGQLYYSLTPTVQLGTYDYNWHWYDGDGRRILTQASSGTTIVAPRPENAGGILSYYVYDGSDVALVLARQAGGSTWWVKQRPLVGGVDQVLAGRYSAAGTQYQNLTLVADRQGSTVAAVKSDGTEELSALYPGRNAFGAPEGASAGGGTNTESGYTGASTPNQTGGFTYLRNRWYDPATGRFLTQDPIGLAGGVNLYSYAGNDPVSYSDPLGLCPECPDEVASVRIGPIVGLRYKAKLGVVKGDIFLGASATGGVKHEVSADGKPDNSLTGGAKLGADLELTAWGEGLQLHFGPRAGADAAGERLTESPVQGDGTISVAGTIPLVWAGPVPVGGMQVEANLNIPAAYRRVRDGVKNLLGATER